MQPCSAHHWPSVLLGGVVCGIASISGELAGDMAVSSTAGTVLHLQRIVRLMTWSDIGAGSRKSLGSSKHRPD